MKIFFVSRISRNRSIIVFGLVQKSNEKENEKQQELVGRPHLLPLIFYLGKKGKDSS